MHAEDDDDDDDEDVDEDIELNKSFDSENKDFTKRFNQLDYFYQIKKG